MPVSRKAKKANVVVARIGLMLDPAVCRKDISRLIALVTVNAFVKRCQLGSNKKVRAPYYVHGCVMISIRPHDQLTLSDR